MKKIIFIILYFIVVISNLYSQRDVKIGAFNFYPAIFQDNDGEVKGFYVDAFYEIEAKENIQFQYVFGTWNEGLQRIKNGEIDVMVSVAYTNERATYMDYCSTPLITVWGEVYILESSKIDDILGLEGKTIAVMKSDVNGEQLKVLTKKMSINCIFIEKADFQGVFKSIASNEVDAGVVNNTFGAGKSEEYDIRSSGIVFNPFDVHLTVQKNKNAELLNLFDKYLDTWRHDVNSVYNTSRQKWSHGKVGTIQIIPKWLKNSLFSIIGITIILVVFIVLLRYRVKKATIKVEESKNQLIEQNKELNLLSGRLSEKNRLLFVSKKRFETLFSKSPISLWEEDYSSAKGLLIKKKLEVKDLKNYLDENPEFVKECILKIEIIRVNKNTLDLFGVKNKNELLNLLQKNLNYEALEVLKKELLLIVSDKKEFSINTKFIRKDGKEISTILKLAKLDDLGRVSVSLTDITSLKHIENELIKSKEKAIESDELKTEFINNLSHEIRTPMNGIIGFSGMLNGTDISVEKRANFIRIIQSSGQQLLNVIDDILEISRLGTKQVKVIESDVCLNDILLALFSTFDLKAKEQKNPLYLKNALSDKQSTIRTDKTKLNKILSNLLENALKFTNEGFIEFGYQLKNDNIEFYVKDTGIGIEKSKHESIFERFSQAEKDLSKKIGGLGLGLSIAKENAELLGGSIQLKSKEGKGATFFVTIPYKPVYKATDIEKSKTVSKYTILIAEDEEINYLYIETLLKDVFSLECKIIHVINGKEAFEACKENKTIDLVFMDLKMPILNGFEATKLIKNLRPNLPVIAQTAYSALHEKEQAILVGCDDFISKPIPQESLKNILDKYLIIK